MDVCKRLQGYRRVMLNSLTVAAYSALNLTSLTTIIIAAPRCAVKFWRLRRLIISAGSATHRLFFGGGAR